MSCTIPIGSSGISQDGATGVVAVGSGGILNESPFTYAKAFMRTRTVPLRTGTGTQDLIIPGLIAIPKGLRIGIQLGTTLGTEATNTAASWAVADDSGNCAFVGVSCEDGTTTNNTDRASHLIGSTIELLDGAGTLSTVITIDSDDANAGPIAGGWRINVTTNGDAGAYLTFTVIGGSVVSTLVDAWQQNATQDATTTRTIGFESNLILPISIGNSSQDTLTTLMRLSLGAVAWDGSSITQGSVLWRSNNGSATPSLATTISDDDCGGEGSVYAVEVTSVTSTQVEFTTRDGANTGSDYVAALFVGLPDGVRTYVGIENSPTSAASDWTVSGVGFKPQFAEAITTFVSSYSSPGLQVVDSEANLVGVHTIDADNNQSSISMFYEDGASPTHNGNVYADDRFVSSYDDLNNVRAFDMEPSASPFNADGFTISADDITAVDSTARAWLVWAIGDPTSPSFPDTGNIPGRSGWPMDVRHIRRRRRRR